MRPTDQLELPVDERSMAWLQVWFPQPFPEQTALGLLRDFATHLHAPQLILEARASASADGSTVEHLIGCQYRYADRIALTIESLVPGSMVVRLGVDERQPMTVARRLTVSNPQRLLQPANLLSSVKSIRRSLVAVSGQEQLVVQIVLGPRWLPQLPPPEEPHREGQSWVSKALDGILAEDRPEAKKGRAEKLGQHGFSAVVRIGVSAFGENRRKTLLLGVASAMRTVNAPGVHLRHSGEHVARLNVPRSSWPIWPLVGGSQRLSVNEVMYLSGWPVAEKEQAFPGQPPLHPRKLRPTPLLLTGKQVLAKANAPGVNALLGYSVDDACRHMTVLGPPGTGKSTLLLNMIVSDLEANRPVVVIEPKDLINDVLRRIPASRKRDIVVLDPLDDCPVGLNPFDRLRNAPHQIDAHAANVVADNVYGMFIALYGLEGLGPRSGEVLRYSLKAIARQPNASLIMIPLMLTMPGFRKRLTEWAIENDPFAAAHFWNWLDGLTPEQVAEKTAPLGNKVRPVIDDHLRAVIAQQNARFNVRDVLTKKKVLLVPLQSGVLGKVSASLLSAVVIGELWTAIKERVAIPEAQRDPVKVYIDEIQEFLRIRDDIGESLAQARSLRVGFVLANQYLKQLPGAMQEALKSNARNKVCFQLSTDDAREMTQGQSVLAPDDFTSLPAHQVYLKLVRNNSVQPWASGATLPPPPETSDPSEIRRLSREQYGRPRAQVEAEFLELLKEPIAEAEHPTTKQTQAQRPQPPKRPRGQKQRHA